MTTFLQRFDDIVRAPQIELEKARLCAAQVVQLLGHSTC
jgi:hypothetical protein